MEKLQKFDYHSSPYHRPNQDWVCGWADSGQCCQLGPDVRGRCRVAAQCQPLLEGDRWQCARSDLHGGCCPKGPSPAGQCGYSLPPCRPRRSWRSRRRILTRWFASLAVGLVLLVVVSDSVPVLFEPGARSAAHAEIDDCRACHLTADFGPASWLRAALGQLPGRSDTERCLDCHRVGEAPRLAHSVDPSRLAPLTDAQLGHASRPPWNLSLARASFPGTDQDLACGVCHQEHRGAKANLEEVTNGRCQICHVAPFASLAEGHPEFSAYPAPRRTRIQFDHVSHFSKHFAEDAQLSPPATCSACHAPDNAGRLMLVKPFETVCASCHESDIAGAGRAGARGLAVIEVPGLDVETLEARGFGAGVWPRHADAAPGPFLRRLLQADPAAVAALAELGRTRLWDLRTAEPGQLAAAQTLALCIKALLQDLALRGGLALVERLEAQGAEALDSARRGSLVAMLPAAALSEAAAQWFPGLDDELAAWRAGQPLPAPAEASSRPPGPPAPAEPDLFDGDDGLLGGGLFDGDLDAAAPASSAPAAAGKPRGHSIEERMRFGGWYVEDLALRYRPAGHRDNFVRAWIEAESGTELFDHLTQADSPGRCGYCHSVDESAAGVSVNWYPRMPKPKLHPFAVFSHTAHFSMLGDPGCKTCHQLNPAAPYAQGFEDRNPATYASNYFDIDREVCADCHTPELAGNDCTLCHRYHIGEFEPTVPSTRLVDFTR